MNFTRIAVAVLAIAVSGCKCGPGTTNSKPDYVALPTALDFSACPTKDVNNQPVADGGVFPDEKKVKIENRGKAPGLFMAKLSGTAADRFSVVNPPMGIPAGGTIELPVRFSPEKSGGAVATLTIDDGDDDTTNITVDLNGEGKNLPAQPTLEVSVEDFARPGTFITCVGGVLCRQSYPNTLLKDSTSLRVKLKNLGCPKLSVTELSLEWANVGGEQMAYFLDQPTPPSGQNPIEMSIADGTDEKILVVRFSPEAVPSMDTPRFGNLTIRSNDFNVPAYQLQFVGEGVIPALGPIPSFCNFNDMNDPCKRAPGIKEANKAEFTLVNDGSSALKIDSSIFKSSGMGNTGSGTRFRIMTPIDGAMLMPGMSTVLTVLHTDEPLFVIDQITVSASVPGADAGSLGKVFLTVAGGTEPCLETDPDATLSFMNSTTELTTKTITVKALATNPVTMLPCGDLIVDGVEIPANPFFTVVAPMLTPMQRIAAGQQATINVQYKKPITGGRQAGDIIIKTNDLDYGAPSFKKLLLESDSPLNELPRCELRVCDARMTDCTMGADQSLMVRLSMLPTPKNITLWGGNSVDPDMMTLPNNGIAEWKFQAIPPSPNVPGWSLTGMQLFSAQNYQTLTLDPSATGQYKAFLYVKDTSGQQSAMACQVNINVYQ